MSKNADPIKEKDPPTPAWLRKLSLLACTMGRHDFEIVQVSYTYTDKGTVEKLQCRRCGLLITRKVEK